MLIRPALPGDVRAIAEVHVAAWRAAYRGLVPDAYLDDLTVEKRVELWTRRLSQPRSSRLLVAESVGTLRGFCLFELGEIVALNVHPDSWRHGVGKALCESVLMEAPGRGWSELTLWILKGNERAARFYESLGFSFEGTERRDPYIAGVYELRYRRPV